MTEASPAAVADELKPWAYPNALRSSISYWWNSGKATAPQEAETALLERGLTPHGIRLVRATPADDATLEPDAETAVMRKVVLPGKDSKRFLNTLEMAPRAKSTDGEETMPIVCLHGYVRRGSKEECRVFTDLMACRVAAQAFTSNSLLPCVSPFPDLQTWRLTTSYSLSSKYPHLLFGHARYVTACNWQTAKSFRH